MLTYKRFVAFSVSLLSVLSVGAVNALFMTPCSEWFQNLVRPTMNAELHSFLWLGVYLLTAVIGAEFLISKKLRPYLWSIGVLLILNPLWCLVFFRLHSAVAGAAILALAVANLIYISIVSAKNTKIHWIFCIATTCWYIFLAAMNIVIAVLNF